MEEEVITYGQAVSIRKSSPHSLFVHIDISGFQSSAPNISGFFRLIKDAVAPVISLDVHREITL